ncbi:MAG TPA: PQQ-binding-like beta-propeller repeat protein [Rhizomicrobium sp.]|nr:PQQ-binding-like beta-propeller repeat protein [Rhizomicrobium sp.]
MKRVYAYVYGLLLAILTVPGTAISAPIPDEHSWLNWGNGLRFDNYSAADQIDKSNAATLAPVWKYELHQRGRWEMTPIVAGGLLYGIDLEGRAFALDPETGKEEWHFASGLRGNMRAVSYWPGDSGHKPRIIMSILDRIYELDAATGVQIEAFGGGQGYVNIRDGFAESGPSYRLSVPPTVYKNLLITGVSTQEFGSKGPPGDPRAYDAVTGRLVWRFHIIPHPGEPNFGSWGPEGWQGRSGPTTWGMISLDDETGLIFIPVGQPTDNYVGTDRRGNNLYSDSIVALDAGTGKYRWYYQMVHHDLWDFDASAPAALIDLTVKGKRVPALVEVTKMGLMFILDRRTGKPVFGVEERPVPQSTIPGEHTSPTQPFPIKPPPLGKLGVSRADISTITPEVQRYCTDSWNRMGFRDAPIYTPPSLTAPLLYSPTNAGGAGGIWGGVSIDPRTNTIFVNVANFANYVSIHPDDGAAGSKSRGSSTGGYRTDEAFSKWLDPNGMPCIQPPWGEMVAVNGNTGEIVWRAPLGKAEIYGDAGAHTGMLNYAGSLATAGGLVFVGGTTTNAGDSSDDPEIRAYDMRTGVQVWSARISGGTKSNLMTFVGKSGRQYLIATAGGRSNVDIEIDAFALPRPGDQPVDIHPAPMPTPASGKQASSMATFKAAVRVEDLPPGPGRDDVAITCTKCHAISTATGTMQTLNGWNSTIGEMRARGAVIDDAMATRIADYLAAHFGPN